MQTVTSLSVPLPSPATGFPLWNSLVQARGSCLPSPTSFSNSNPAPFHVLNAASATIPMPTSSVAEPLSTSTLLNSLLLQLLQNKAATATARSFEGARIPPVSPPSTTFCALPSPFFTHQVSSPEHEASAPSTPESEAPSAATRILKSGVVALYPRKKRGLESATQEAVILDKKALAALYHLPLKEAAKALGICPTAIKTACRKLGLPKWPYRTLRKQVRSSVLSSRAPRRGVGA